MRKGHYAWAICLACALLYLCHIGLSNNALAIYLPFIEAGGISGRAGSAVLSVFSLSSFLGLLFVETYYKKVSLRRGLLLASLIGVLSPLCYSRGGSIFNYYTGAALAGIAYSLGCVIPTSFLVTNWFHERRGLALGLASAGSGVATVLLLPMLSRIILRHSLRTAFLVQAGIMGVSGLLVFLLVRDTPQETGREPYGRQTEQKKAQKKKGAPLPAHTPWILILLMMLVGGVGQGFSGHLSVLVRSSGYRAEIAAETMSVFGLMLILGKPVGGAVTDRLGTKRSSVLFMLTFALGNLLVLPLNGSARLLCYLLAAVLGLGAPIFSIGMPLWAADFSTGADYAKTLKRLQLSFCLGGMVFSVLPGMIADQTGEYKTSYLLFSIMMIVSLLLLLWVYRISRKPRREITP